MAQRKRIDSHIEARVLERSARRCCLCVALDRDFGEKPGQLAHLDHDPTNNSEDNLAFLCMAHHSLYDSSTSQHKNYTMAEIKSYRRELYEKILDLRQPKKWVLVMDAEFSDYEKPRVEAIMEHLQKHLSNTHLTMEKKPETKLESNSETSAAGPLIRGLLSAKLYQAKVSPNKLKASEPRLQQEVFVSYAWTEESKAIVDQLQRSLEASGISITRDKTELRYKDSIRAFMRRVGRGKCIVVVLSRRYLQSKSCMFELTEIADREDIRHRVFPIVLSDTCIYDASGRIAYVNHWDRKIAALNRKIKETASNANLTSIHEELNLFVKIRSTIDGLVDTLADMNALTPEQHQGSNFRELEYSLKVRLSE